MQNGRNLPDFFVLILDQMENGRNLPDCEMQRGRSTGNRSKMVGIYRIREKSKKSGGARHPQHVPHAYIVRDVITNRRA